MNNKLKLILIIRNFLQHRSYTFDTKLCKLKANLPTNFKYSRWLRFVRWYDILKLGMHGYCYMIRSWIQMFRVAQWWRSNELTVICDRLVLFQRASQSGKMWLSLMLFTVVPYRRQQCSALCQTIRVHTANQDTVTSDKTVMETCSRDIYALISAYFCKMNPLEELCQKD